jgi:hypothetical protein
MTRCDHGSDELTRAGNRGCMTQANWPIQGPISKGRSETLRTPALPSVSAPCHVLQNQYWTAAGLLRDNKMTQVCSHRIGPPGV